MRSSTQKLRFAILLNIFVGANFYRYANNLLLFFYSNYIGPVLVAGKFVMFNLISHQTSNGLLRVPGG